jgi:hypothetical protein
MPHSGAGSRVRLVACYGELPRIVLPRTRVNRPDTGRDMCRSAQASRSPAPLCCGRNDREWRLD